MENKINFDEVFKIIRFILLLIILLLLAGTIWQNRICPRENFNGTEIVYVPMLMHGEMYCFPKIVKINQTSVFYFFSDEQPGNSSDERYNANE